MTPQEMYIQALMAQQQGGPIVRPYVPSGQQGFVMQSPNAQGMYPPAPQGPQLPVQNPPQPALPLPPEVHQALQQPLPFQLPPGTTGTGVPPPTGAPPVPMPAPTGMSMPAMPLDQAAAQAQMPPQMAPTQQTGQAPMPQMPGGMDGFGMAAQQLPPEVMPGPPSTPEERDRRKAGWQSFFQKLSSDPNLAGMFLKMGTEMMQPVQAGQSPLGHTGRALQSGVDYAVMTKEMQRKAGLEGKRDDREERALGSDLKSQEQQRTIAGKQEARVEGLYGTELEILKDQAKGVKTANEAATLELNLAKFRYEFRDRITTAEMDKLDADIDQAKALAEYYRSGGKAGTAGSAAAMKLTLDAAGATRALAEFNAMVQQLHIEYNERNPKQQKSLQRIQAEFLAESGLGPKWLDTITKTAGGDLNSVADVAAAGDDEDPVVTMDQLKKRVEAERRRNAPAPNPSEFSIPVMP